MPDPNSSRPWASFCMSTYRRTGFLKRSLALLGAQTFKDFEVVISDNDPDRSAEVIVAECNDSRFRYFPNNTNLGMVNSFNKSIERARGEFIVMITDDDPAYPEMLEILHDLYLRYPDYGLYIGAHNTLFAGLQQARMAKARVGLNSSLSSDLEFGAVKVYSREDFLRVYLQGELDGGLLWSTGIVKREIALSIGGFPDYGTPHLADCSYVLLSGASAGCVYINTALGHRTIHADNYSYATAGYDAIYKAPEGFYNWTLNRLAPTLVTPALKASLGRFIGRDMTAYVISIKKRLQILQIEKQEFEAFRRKFFRLPWLKRWRNKYYIAVHFPRLFELFLAFREMLRPPPLKAARK